MTFKLFHWVTAAFGGLTLLIANALLRAGLAQRSQHAGEPVDANAHALRCGYFGLLARRDAERD